jgi:putative molybdopterin biosynthesis protein
VPNAGKFAVLRYLLQGTAMSTYLSTQEVARHLKLRPRTIYELVTQGRIPFAKVSGRLLFPREAIDAWVRQTMSGINTPSNANRFGAPPPTLAGSHDLLLDWAVRESQCGLGLMCYGSLNGVERLLDGSACSAAIHIPGDLAQIATRLERLDCAVVQWAHREQGLLVPKGNPKKIQYLADAVRSKNRFALRQVEAGSHLLLKHLLAKQKIPWTSLQYAENIAQTESEVGMQILQGEADTGLALKAVAKQFQLDFIPLATERLDLAIIRSEYFSEPLQSLFAFTKTRAFKLRAQTLDGYDVSGLGQVLWNSPSR